jgi:hypothetical protein
MIRFIGQDEDTVDLDATADPAVGLPALLITLGIFAPLGIALGMGLALVFGAGWSVAIGVGLLSFVAVSVRVLLVATRRPS